MRLSEVRERLNEIAGLDDALTDEIRGESETLDTEYRDLEVQVSERPVRLPRAEAEARGARGVRKRRWPVGRGPGDSPGSVSR